MSGTGSLEGRRILLTGASRGIGRVVAQHLASCGATLICVARDRASLDAAISDLAGDGHHAAAIDVSDESAWQRVVAPLLGDEPLHGTVTAAGIIGPIGPIGTWSIEAFRTTFDVNVVGTLLAVRSTLEHLLASKGSIVTFSGGGGTAPLARFDAYATSKAALVRLTENLATDLASTGVRLNSVAPGFVVTAMHNETIEAGPDRAGEAYFERTRKAIAEGGGDSPQHAAELTEFLLSEDAAGISGKLLSARWDPWREPEFQERLRTEPALATLRRIDDQFFTELHSS